MRVVTAILIGILAPALILFVISALIGAGLLWIFS